MQDTTQTVIARYLTVAGAIVNLTPEPRGIRATCTGCPIPGWLADYDPTLSGTKNTDWATRQAAAWAQRHAETCRAMPADD
ncbi:hypothetical protein ACGF0D_10665 [Kitasatospora sp. NPDC048298]|uniref:hypothetical protein n=1 Tax=Kitasatospora sp. NPDC048298 TaxID=3364049 RepID=UPI00371030A5